jgi:MFS family permease
MHSPAPVDVWRSLRSLPDFWRLLQVRMASQFGDGLFQAGLAGALLFNPDRAADPMAIARAFTVLFLPYSLLGPFAGALMDRWDRRLVLVGANVGRLVLIAAIGTILAVGAGELPLLIAALLANGLARFVTSGMSAALPHVVPREQVVTMNSVATATGAAAAFLGADFMLLPRWIVGPGDRGASAIIFTVAIPVAIALLLSFRFGPRVLGPDDTRRAIHGSAVYAVITGWLHGARTVLQLPTVSGALSGLAAHRAVIGINSLLLLVLVHHMKTPAVGGLGTALVFFGAVGLGSFLATVLTPPSVRRWGRYATVNGALAASAIIQAAGAGLVLPIMVVCGFLLGVSGQMVKLCADSAIQIDVDDALRGHVFAVQDALFWVSFIVSITVAAILIPDDGHAPAFALFGSVLYLVGLMVHAVVARRRPANNRDGRQ